MPSTKATHAGRAHHARTTWLKPAAALAVLVASLVCAASSQAAPEFIFAHGSTQLSAIEGTKLFSGSEGEQQFDFGGIGVECAAAQGSGSGTSGPEGGLVAVLKYKGCVTSGTLGGGSLQLKATVKQPLEVAYNPRGGWAQLRRPFAIDITGVKCVIDVSPLTPEEESQLATEELEDLTTYRIEDVATSKTKTFPSGFQAKIRIHTALYAHYQLAGSCASEAPNPQGSGEYSGLLWDESKQADMTWYVRPENSRGW